MEKLGDKQGPQISNKLIIRISFGENKKKGRLHDSISRLREKLQSVCNGMVIRYLRYEKCNNLLL